jgi:hypothetical protein
LFWGGGGWGGGIKSASTANNQATWDETVPTLGGPAKTAEAEEAGEAVEGAIWFASTASSRATWDETAPTLRSPATMAECASTASNLATWVGTAPTLGKLVTTMIGEAVAVVAVGGMEEIMEGGERGEGMTTEGGVAVEVETESVVRSIVYNSLMKPVNFFSSLEFW